MMCEDVDILPVISAPATEICKEHCRWQAGKYTFRADFDSGNLLSVSSGPNANEFLLYTKKDCHGSQFEKGTRSWFFFGVSGQQTNDFIILTIMNLNKQGRLFSQDYRPWWWAPGQTEWQPCANKVTYRREDEDFQLRFTHKFMGPEEVFFAFAIPHSYRDLQVMLTNLLARFDPRSQTQSSISTSKPHTTEAHDHNTPSHQGSADCMDRSSVSEAVARHTVGPPEARGHGPGTHVHSSGTNGTTSKHGGCPIRVPSKRSRIPSIMQSRTSSSIHSAHKHSDHSSHTGATAARHHRQSSSNSHCSDHNQALDHSSQIYFNRQVLARSLEGRCVDLITITDCFGTNGTTETLPHLDQQAATSECPSTEMHDHGGVSTAPALHFPGKKVFFITARVHPGETPASHMFTGMLAFLLRRNDARAAALRRLFVFKLVPMVNPDGVYHGYYRTDTMGANLNRFYQCPDKATHPGVWAIKQQLMSYAAQGSLEFYLDLHAHANKKGVFIYGNALEGERCLHSLVYAKLVALNNPLFDFQGCNYTEKNMSRADKDGMSKEGASRVAIYKETNITHLYTIEANYNTCRQCNPVAPASGSHNGRASPPSVKRQPPRFTSDALQSVGRAFLVAALDMKGSNPWSRLPCSEHRDLVGVASWISAVAKAPSDARSAHLPALSETCINTLKSCSSGWVHSIGSTPHNNSHSGLRAAGSAAIDVSGVCVPRDGLVAVSRLAVVASEGGAAGRAFPRSLSNPLPRHKQDLRSMDRDGPGSKSGVHRFASNSSVVDDSGARSVPGNAISAPSSRASCSTADLEHQYTESVSLCQSRASAAGAKLLSSGSVLSTNADSGNRLTMPGAGSRRSSASQIPRPPPQDSMSNSNIRYGYHDNFDDTVCRLPQVSTSGSRSRCANISGTQHDNLDQDKTHMPGHVPVSSVSLHTPETETDEDARYDRKSMPLSLAQQHRMLHRQRSSIPRGPAAAGAIYSCDRSLRRATSHSTASRHHHHHGHHVHSTAGKAAIHVSEVQLKLAEPVQVILCKSSRRHSNVNDKLQSTARNADHQSCGGMNQGASASGTLGVAGLHDAAASLVMSAEPWKSDVVKQTGAFTFTPIETRDKVSVGVGVGRLGMPDTRSRHSDGHAQGLQDKVMAAVMRVTGDWGT